MKRFSCLQYLLAVVACSGMLLPASALAAHPAPSPVVDIALQEGGLLLGQVMSPEGLAQVAEPVSIRRGGEEVLRVATDTRGAFTAEGLRGGIYTLATSQGASTFRLWSAGTAPPSAQPQVLLVSGTDVVRGQLPGFGREGILRNPWVLAAIVATAIAVPIAVSDDNNAS